MMLPFGRVVVLAVLSFSALTSAIPVVPAAVESTDLAVDGVVADGEVHALDARARKAKAPKKPKTKKPAKPKTTKKPAKPKTKKPVKPKTKKPVKPKTKKPVKPKTTKKPAKPKTTKKPTKPKTTKKPTKPKTTKKPAKPKTTKPAKPTKTKSTKPTKTKSTKAPKPTAQPTACPLPKPKPKKKVARAVMDYVVSLFKRQPEEFIGWHGTNSKTATYWASKGHIAKPPTSPKSIDTGDGSSGADHELGPGLYVTDTLGTALGFANINAGQNPGTTATICAVYALSKTRWNWADSVLKVWIPNEKIGDSSDPMRKTVLEKGRDAFIRSVYPKASPNDVVRFAPMDRNRPNSPVHQIMIPSSLTANFHSICVPAASVKANDPKTWPLNTHELNYSRNKKIWNILEHADVCAANNQH